MHKSTWKKWETYVAKKLGGVRRGADYGGVSGGKDDIIHKAYSVECKVLSQIQWCDVQAAIRQAEANAPTLRMPLAVLRKKGQPKSSAVVCIGLDTFAEWHGSYRHD